MHVIKRLEKLKNSLILTTTSAQTERERGAQREIFESEMMHGPCMEMHADIVIHDIMKHTPRGARTHTETHRSRNPPRTTTRL